MSLNACLEEPKRWSNFHFIAFRQIFLFISSFWVNLDLQVADVRLRQLLTTDLGFIPPADGPPSGVPVGDISICSSSPMNERFEKQHNPSVTSYITNCFVNNLWYHLSNDHHGGLSYGVTAGRMSIQGPVGPRWFRQAELWPPVMIFPSLPGKLSRCCGRGRE